MRRRDLLVGAAALLLIRDALAQDRVKPAVRRDARPGDKLATGADAEMVFVVQRDAILLRRSSSLELLNNGFRLVSGAVLAVFAPGARKTVQTATATLGIRGTAVYLEVERTRTYVCICYGEAVLEPVADPKARETVRTKHHEQPRYIMAQRRAADGDAGAGAQPHRRGADDAGKPGRPPAAVRRQGQVLAAELFQLLPQLRQRRLEGRQPRAELLHHLRRRALDEGLVGELCLGRRDLGFGRARFPSSAGALSRRHPSRS